MVATAVAHKAVVATRFVQRVAGEVVATGAAPRAGGTSLNESKSRVCLYARQPVRLVWATLARLA